MQCPEYTKLIELDFGVPPPSSINADRDILHAPPLPEWIKLTF
jgi:hypothetical protein